MLRYSHILRIFSLFLVFHCPDVSGDGYGCAPPWMLLHRTCVHFIDKPFLSWQQARDNCSSLDSELLSIDSKQENKNIKQLMKYHLSTLGFSEWWLGLRQVNGTWQWVDSEEIYAKIPAWAPASDGYSDSREDNNMLIGDNCAVIDDNGKLREKDCIRELRPFICERFPISTTSAVTETTKEKGGQEVKPTWTTPKMIDRERPSGPTRRPTSNPRTERPEDSRESTTKPRKDDQFVGCYAVNYESTCPPVQAFGISWPRTEPGKMAKVSCGKGQAKWKCDKKPTCWREQPDVKQCTSESVQKLTQQADEFLANPEDSEKAMAFTGDLATMVSESEELTEQDVYQTTKLMDAASNAKPKNSKEAKGIIKNVAMCGNALVRQDKKKTWSKMSKESQRNIASSLLNSMESVTNKLLKAFDTPTVENIVEDNIEIQLQVINVSIKAESDDTMFRGDTSSFSIPSDILKQFNTDGLARLVFINYDNVGPLLNPADEAADDNTERRVMSHVISASLDGEPGGKSMNKPVTFTMKIQNQISNQDINDQLCSFWNFNLGFSGAWSQEGCSLSESNKTHVTCQCDHLTNFAVLMDIHSIKMEAIHATTLSYITYVGIIISLVCLFLTWITFVCLSIRCIRGTRSSYGHAEGNEYYGHSGSYTGSTAGARSAQGERNSIHKNLAFCLFIAELLFISGIDRTDNKVACAIMAGFLHYFFLSSFTWMFVEGIQILFMLVQVFDAARSRLRYYHTIGYGAPLLIVGISALVYYEGYGTERYCWLTTDRNFIWSFAGPVAFILLINLVVLIYAMSTVCKHSDYVFDKDKSMFGSFRAWIQGALAMEVLLGLTWVFGFLYISEGALPMAYFFTIFNTLQGLFIFIFHCILNKKVRSEYSRFLNVPRRYSLGWTNSSKGANPSGSDPRKDSVNINGTREQPEFINLEKDRRPSSRSTTSA